MSTPSYFISHKDPVMFALTPTAIYCRGYILHQTCQYKLLHFEKVNTQFKEKKKCLFMDVFKYDVTKKILKWQ